jgi:chromatin assembly factor 1 subunit A
LSKLVIKISEKLEECHKKQWPVESINTKIKLLSKRKSHLDIPSPSKSIDLFEDEHEDRMWRWEIVMLDLLPSSVLPKVRKARSARRKVSSHYTATNKLIKSVQDAELFILDTKLPQLDTVLAKISRDEEKVLKYERETEKQRITLQAKKRKEQELESKRREKELLAEEKLHKKQEAEQKKLDKEKEKQEVLQARDEAKRKKIGERENRENQKKQKQQEEEQKIERLNKQKAMMMSFLAAPQKQKSKPAVESNKDAKTSDQATESSDISVSSDSFDLDKFRSKIDSLDSHGPKASLFKRLSSDATKSRKRRTCQVPLSIYVTVMPENANAFDAQPFAEQRIVHFPNKYSFRSFHEDCRPAYHGTWSKKSSIVTGRNPFGKDTTYLDYEYDSEGEWEEGDDDMGEDIEDDTKNQEEEEEEGDVKVYDYDDGFCVADDQYLDTDDDVDEETKVLYKKKLQSGGGDPAIVANRVCILAPAPGGVPLGESNLANANLIQGFDKQVGFNLLSSYRGKQLLNENIWLDAFPPAMVDEVEVPADAAAQPGDTSANKDEYAVEEMRSLAIFAHHNALNSKEKLIEELRNAHPDIFVSRAKAIRKLDSIAVKQKHPSAPGVYWEVKTEVLEELALKDVLVSCVIVRVFEEARFSPC